MDNQAYVIEMNQITKIFPGIIANDKVDLKVKKCEIHALLGENGAGKSTLMSILFGMYQPEEGEIKINGKSVKITNPNIANDLGIGMVHQHFKLVQNFTVLQNIVLGAEDSKFGVLKMNDARKKVESLVNHYKLNVNLDAKIEDITVGMQQRVEILKMLYRDNDILIFDEPTAVLTVQEIAELMKIMKALVAEGKSIVFITHKLNEIKEVADRCTILRKGKFIDCVDVKSTSTHELSRLMVGRDVSFTTNKKQCEPQDVALKLENVSVAKAGHKNVVNNVSFEVRRGEIVCLAGIDGNGQTELVYAISGLVPSSGNIYIKDRLISNLSIRKRNECGLAHIPEDRHKHGLVLEYSLEDNTVLKDYYKPEYQKNGFLKFDAIRKNAEKLIENFDIRSGQGAVTTARSMSGGNQQKVILAREISSNPEVLLAVQPTRGLDVGAIEYVHKEIIQQRDRGCAVFVVSLELDEVMNLSDRILVIYEGEIVADLDPKQTTREELGIYMTGAKRGVGYEK